MANPQKENGYTAVANEILEQICLLKLNGTQFKIIIILWRYTYGFSRREHDLSESFIAKATNTHKIQLSKELSKLIELNIIKVIKEATFTKSRVLAFNKNYSEWKDRQLVNSLTLSEIDNTTVSEITNTTVSEFTNQDKQNIKQNIKQKNTPKIIKHKYGEFKHVLLTDDEKERLISDLGQDMFNKCIVKLDEYIEMKGYKARSHNLCIRKWVINAVNEEFNKTRKKGDENKTYGETYDTGNCYSLEYYEQFRNVK